MHIQFELNNQKSIDFLPLVQKTDLKSSLADDDPLGSIDLLLQKKEINDVKMFLQDGKTAVKSSFVASLKQNQSSYATGINTSRAFYKSQRFVDCDFRTEKHKKTLKKHKKDRSNTLSSKLLPGVPKKSIRIWSTLAIRI